MRTPRNSYSDLADGEIVKHDDIYAKNEGGTRCTAIATTTTPAERKGNLRSLPARTTDGMRKR